MARAFYDATAERYAEQIGTEVTPDVEGPLDRALLEAFVELVAGGPVGPVADVGCGPGRVAAFLAARGVEVVGIDPSTAMLAVARRAHPGLRFEEGTLADLPVPDASLAGAVCWYSVIHAPPGHLGEVAAELARVLAPGGHLLVAFQAGGGEAVLRAATPETAIPLTSHRHDPDDVADRLAGAGLIVDARAVRAPSLPHESTPQAFLSARSPDR